MPPHQVIQQVSQQPIAGPQQGGPPQMMQGKQRNDSMSSESSYTMNQQYHHQQQRHSLTQMQVTDIRYSLYFPTHVLGLCDDENAGFFCRMFYNRQCVE